MGHIRAFSNNSRGGFMGPLGLLPRLDPRASSRCTRSRQLTKGNGQHPLPRSSRRLLRCPNFLVGIRERRHNISRPANRDSRRRLAAGSRGFSNETRSNRKPTRNSTSQAKINGRLLNRRQLDAAWPASLCPKRPIDRPRAPTPRPRSQAQGRRPAWCLAAARSPLTLCSR